MFSALKKLVGTDGQNKGTVPCGMQAMGQNLQKKFAKGVQYNMKIIIKGDRNTGKTTLFHRLQGQKFIEDYIATQEIQVASIQWNYKNTDDIVKVEVWDVVDRGKSRKKNDGLKLENDPDAKSNSREPCLDAEFLDVYKGTHGVVMLMDVTKQWTYDYIQRELPKIPNHIPVLVLANFADMGEHRVVGRDDVKYFVEHFERPVGSTIIRFAESSMKNGFGLKYLHQFFNVPFLILQRETLMRQLETNRKDIDCILEELDIHAESDEQNYEVYVETLATKQRNQAKQKAAAVAAAAEAAANKEDSDDGKSPSQVGSNCVTPNSLTPSKISPAPSPGATTPTRQVQTPSTEGSSKSIQQRVSRFFGGSNSSSVPAKLSSQEQNTSLEIPVPSPGKVKSVEDFVVGDDIGSFLEDTTRGRHDSTSLDHGHHHTMDSDDDEEGHNPMVAGFTEDIDSEDEQISQKDTPAVAASFHIELSSDDDDSPFATHHHHHHKDVDEIDAKKKSPLAQITEKTVEKFDGLDLGTVNGAICNDSVDSIEVKTKRNRKSTTDASDDVSQSEEDEDQNNQVSMVIEDPEEEDLDAESLKSKESTKEIGSVSVSSPGLYFDSTDLDFLESHTIGSKKTSSSTTPTTSSVASTKEGSSEEDTRKGSSKKKKHKEKDRDRDKDGERSHKKHKHKKNKEKDRDRDRDDTGKEKKKKKKPKKTEEDQEKDKEMDELEAFLSGGDKTPNKGGGDYEVF